MIYFLSTLFVSCMITGLITTFFIVYYQKPKLKAKNAIKGQLYSVDCNGNLMSHDDFERVEDCINSCVTKDQLENAFNLLERYKAKHGRTDLYFELEACYYAKMGEWIGI